MSDTKKCQQTQHTKLSSITLSDDNPTTTYSQFPAYENFHASKGELYHYNIPFRNVKIS